LKVNNFQNARKIDMLLGIDVSKWQGELDWNKARSAGARFAFVRAGAVSTTGHCYTDYQFERNALLAPDYMPIGFYWYFRPQHDPISQANYYCSLIRDKRSKLPAVIDLEQTGNLNPKQITAATSQMARQMFHRMNKWPLLYTRAMWLNANTISDPIWNLLRLWIARYKAIAGPWSDGSCKPRDYDEWDFWQFSADNNHQGPTYGAKSKSIDLDYFNGDAKDLDRYIGESVVPNMIQITSRISTIDCGPGGVANGVTWKGTRWQAVGLSEDGEYYRVEGWIRVGNAEKL
jgi:lysozyme